MRRRRKPPVDRWLDGHSATLSRWTGRYSGRVRTPKEKRDMIAIQKDADAEAVVWRIPDAQLETASSSKASVHARRYCRSGRYAARWFGVGRRQQTAVANSSAGWRNSPAARLRNSSHRR